jgi:Ca-activated chloride channel homolog
MNRLVNLLQNRSKFVSHSEPQSTVEAETLIKQTHSSDDPVEFVVCVVDQSGSMNYSDFHPTRLKAAIQAVNTMMDQKKAIDHRDKVAVVGFNNGCRCVSGFDDDRYIAKEKTEQLRPDGSTNIFSGLSLAIKLLHDIFHGRYKRQDRIVLLSDGGHNTGPNPLSIIPTIRDTGVIVDAIAIGTPGKSDYNEKLLREISNETGGTFCVITNLDDLIKKYRQLAQKKRGQITQTPRYGIKRIR